MLKSFLSRLSGDTTASQTPSASDERIAVAALLVHAARIDDSFTEVESDLIAAILAHRYKLPKSEAAELRDVGARADDAAVDTFRFTHTIRSILPPAERLTVLEALWSVVLSDEDKDSREDGLVRKLVELLDMSPHDSAHARQRVLAAMKA